nr:MAG TPA: hypothetical protein [Caudoviricetes sp.]
MILNRVFIILPMEYSVNKCRKIIYTKKQPAPYGIDCS